MAQHDSLSAELLEAIEDEDFSSGPDYILTAEGDYEMHHIAKELNPEVKIKEPKLEPVPQENTTTHTTEIVNEDAYMKQLTALLDFGQEDQFVVEVVRRRPQDVSRDINGLTLLQRAALRGFPTAITILLGTNPDADANRTTVTERTPPLVLAAREGHWQAVSSILQASGSSLDVDAEDAQGDSALHHAARAAQLDSVVQLVRRGADPWRRNALGLTPFGPEEARALLDRCVTSGVAPGDADEFEIVFDYRLLAPGPRVNNGEEMVDAVWLPETELMSGEMDFIRQLTECDVMSPLLNHPVIVSFLQFKWKRLRILVYAGFIMKLFYVIFVQALVISRGIAVKPLYQPRDDNRITSSDASDTEDAQFDDYQYVGMFTVALGLFLLVMCVSRRDFYMNIALVVSIFSALIITFLANSIIFTSLAVLSSSYVLLLEFHRLPVFTYPIQLTKFVAKRYATFLAPFIFIILILGVGLHLILVWEHGRIAITNKLESWLKSLMQAFLIVANSHATYYQPSLLFEVYSLVLVCGSVILLNILMGLAITDMQQIDKIAKELQLLASARKLCRAETCCVKLHNFLRAKRVVPECVKNSLRKILLFPSAETGRSAHASLKASSKVHLADGEMSYALSQDVLVQAGQIVKDRVLHSTHRRQLDTLALGELEERLRNTLAEVDEKIQERLRYLEIKLGVFSHRQNAHVENCLRSLDKRLESIHILLDRRLPESDF